MDSWEVEVIKDDRINVLFCHSRESANLGIKIRNRSPIGSGMTTDTHTKYMNIIIAKERILILTDRFSVDEARVIAGKKRMASFGAVSQMTSLFSVPKDDDFEEVYFEHRYEPFWHVSAHAKYVFDRRTSYSVPVSDSTVRKISVVDVTYDINASHTFSLPVTEHCTLEESISTYTDAVSGKEQAGYSAYTGYDGKIVKTTIESTVSKESIIIPPSVRVSAIVRETLAKLIKGIQADTISEEEVTVDSIDLYYHPIHAFEYVWKTKGKKGIVQVDGCTGAVTTGQRTFAEFIGKKIDTNFLFDVGADAAGMFIPGGSIAVKVAKKYIDSKKHS